MTLLELVCYDYQLCFCYYHCACRVCIAIFEFAEDVICIAGRTRSGYQPRDETCTDLTEQKIILNSGESYLYKLCCITIGCYYYRCVWFVSKLCCQVFHYWWHRTIKNNLFINDSNNERERWCMIIYSCMY